MTSSPEASSSFPRLRASLRELSLLDRALYVAVAESETPTLDAGLRRLSLAADKSKLWFGVATAMALLGGGHDIPPDRPAAQEWFRRAAEKGHPYALLMLGRYLARGLAGVTDLAQARRCLEQARAAGAAEAAEELARLPPMGVAPAPAREPNVAAQ